MSDKKIGNPRISKTGRKYGKMDQMPAEYIDVPDNEPGTHAPKGKKK